MNSKYVVLAITFTLLMGGCKKKAPEATPEPAPKQAAQEEAVKTAPGTEKTAVADVKAEMRETVADLKEDTQPAAPVPTSGPELWKVACSHAFALAKKDEALAEVYLQRQRLAKECEEEFSSIHAELADKAAQCVLAVEAFSALTGCFDTSKYAPSGKVIDGEGEKMWREACDHAVELVRVSGALDGAGEEIIRGVKQECLAQFAQSDNAMADQAARCMLAQGSMETLDGCVLQLRSADRKEEEARPPLNEDPWGDVATLHAELFQVFDEGMAEPTGVRALLDAWYQANTAKLETTCVRMRRLPAEDTERNYSDRIQFYTEFVNLTVPARLEAALPPLVQAFPTLEERQKVATQLGRFMEICTKAQAHGLGQPDDSSPPGQ